MRPVEPSRSPLQTASLQADTRHRVLYVHTSPGEGRLRASAGKAAAEGPLGTPLQLDLPDAELWTPQTPALFDLRLEWSGGSDGKDSRTLRTGLRHAELRGPRFHLNGRAVPLFGVRIATAALPAKTGEAAALATRILTMGATLVRITAEVAAAPLLDACDEAGVLVWLDLPAGLEDPAFVREQYAAHGHHPAVVIWGGTRTACEALHSFAPNVLLIAAEGPPGVMGAETAGWQPLVRAAIRLDMPPGPGEAKALRRMGAEDQPAWVSGTVNEADCLPPAMAAKQNDAVRAAWRQHGEGIGRQLADAFWSNAGLTGWDLPIHAWPSPAATGLGVEEHSAERLHLALHMERTNLLIEEETAVRTVLVNKRRSLAQASLSLQVTGPTRQTLWKKKRSVRCSTGTKELWAGNIAGSGSPGPHRFVVRLMDGMRRAAENSRDFHVFETPAPFKGSARIIDPQEAWRPGLAALIPTERERAGVIVFPPLAHTVRAYPADETAAALAEVHAGATALVLQPPADWNDLAERVDGLPRATPVWLPNAVPVVRLHALFEGLPSRMLMGSAYAGVACRHFLAETGDEPAGLVQGSDGRKGAFIAVQRYGNGRLLFTTLRLPAIPGQDPLAERLLVNLLRYLEGWSAPPASPPPPVPAVYEWLRRSRAARLQRWAVAGPLPYAPEDAAPVEPTAGIDLGAVYPGWAGPTGWRRWYATEADNFWLDLEAACSPFEPGVTTDAPGVAFAYAECRASERMACRVVFETTQPGQCWLNGKPVARFDDEGLPLKNAEAIAETVLREGRNIVVCSARKMWGPWRIRLRFEGPRGGELPVGWWR